MSKFRNLVLEFEIGPLDETVLDYASRFYYNRMALCDTAAKAWEMYREVVRMPKTLTRQNTLINSNVILNGHFFSETPTSSQLIYAFVLDDQSKMKPCICKISHQPGVAKHEVRIYEDLACYGDVMEHCLVGPVSLLNLQVGEWGRTNNTVDLLKHKCGLVLSIAHIRRKQLIRGS